MRCLTRHIFIFLCFEFKIKSQFIPDNLMHKEDFQKEIKIYTDEIAELKEKIQELKKQGY